MKVDNAKPGDTVELKDKEGGFTDPDTGFDISRDQKLELSDPIGRRTHEAIVSGGLLVVSGSKKKGKDESSDKTDDSDLPGDLPGRDAFLAAGIGFDQVKSMQEEELLAVKGIGAGTVKALVDYAKAQAPKD